MSRSQDAFDHSLPVPYSQLALLVQYYKQRSAKTGYMDIISLKFYIFGTSSGMLSKMVHSLSKGVHVRTIVYASMCVYKMCVRAWCQTAHNKVIDRKYSKSNL